MLLRISTLLFTRLSLRFAPLGAMLLCLLLCTLPAHAQDFRSTLTGQVTDPSGAIVPGAAVTAINNASGTRYTGKTTPKGLYSIPYMLPGIYTVTANAKGFKATEQDKVLLQASETFNQNFALQIGTVGEKGGG